MSQEFRSLPQNFSPGADDELLLVTPTAATRASVKSLFWDNYALLKFQLPGDQNYGIGTADQWGNIPYNTLELDAVNNWIELNADGSFTLNSGRFLIRAEQHVRRVNHGRLAIHKNGAFIAVNKIYSSTSGSVSSPLKLAKKVILESQELFKIQISVSEAFESALQAADSGLAGIQVDVGVCEIYKLG